MLADNALVCAFSKTRSSEGLFKGGQTSLIAIKDIVHKDQEIIVACPQEFWSQRDTELTDNGYVLSLKGIFTRAKPPFLVSQQYSNQGYFPNGLISMCSGGYPVNFHASNSRS